MESSNFNNGGAGAVALGNAVVEACKEPNNFKFLYSLENSLDDKISTIAKEIYGADGINISEQAKAKLDQYTKQGFSKLPICMAKTHLSLSDDPSKKGVPKGFTINVQDVKISAGAGFVYPLCGSIMTMPGLPTRPCFYDIDLDGETGAITGLM